MSGHPFLIEKLRKQARNFDEDVTKKAIIGVAKADRDIRHSTMSPGLLVENLIREISR